MTDSHARISAGSVDAWCQPTDNGKHATRKFLLYFEDADRGIAVFDNETEAREAFTKANTAWNCYLFGALPLIPDVAQPTLRCFDCGRPTICPDCDPTAAQPPAAPRKPICCYCDNDLCCAHCGREQPDDSEQPPAAPVGLDVLRQMVQRQRDIPGMPPQQTGRPSGSNADEWNCFLSEHLNSTSFLAVQIAEAIEDGEKRGSLSRSSAATSDEPDSRLPLQYEDGPDYCTVKDAQGRDFALTMQPELMQAMERALREDIARLSRPPVTSTEPQAAQEYAMPGHSETMANLDALTIRTQDVRSPEAEAEHFIQAAIDSAPEPLQRLGEFLADVLDEDHWKAAERMLLALALTRPHPRGGATE